MRTFVLVITLFALPALASAQPHRVPRIGGDPRAVPTVETGRVRLERVICAKSPCPAFLYLDTGDGSKKLHGGLLDDLEAFEGSVITVHGTTDSRSIRVTGFAPGRSHDFLTATVVREVSVHCPPGGRCEPRVMLKDLDGTQYDIANGTLRARLARMVGSLVTVRGAVRQPRCRCNAQFTGTASSPMLFRGLYRELSAGMNGQRGWLISEGNTLLVGGDSLPSRDGVVLWIEGKFGTEPIGGEPILRATMVSGPLPLDDKEILSLSEGRPAGGSDVARHAQTSGSVPSGAAGRRPGAGRPR